MYVKTLFMLSVFFIPLVIVSFGLVSNVYLLMFLYAISGLGMSGVGMCVMHDALHGTYSSKPKINKLLGYTLNVIGANARIWKIQHNVLHHTYTNIDHYDDDINVPPFILRFSPNERRAKIHKYQHLYVWPLYGISTIIWVVIKDYVRLFRYHKIGLVNPKRGMFIEVLKITAWKVLYYSYVLLLPILFSGFGWLTIILAFVVLHFVTGVSLSVVFQLAHVMPDNEYPLPNGDHIIEDNWLVHQIKTTTNFAPKSVIMSWMIGGLNYQIEHHLFPNICHVHYPKISGIVKKTTEEFGLVYHCKPTFFSAFSEHVKMLKNLGTQDLAYKGI